MVWRHFRPRFRTGLNGRGEAGGWKSASFFPRFVISALFPAADDVMARAREVSSWVVTPPPGRKASPEPCDGQSQDRARDSSPRSPANLWLFRVWEDSVF